MSRTKKTFHAMRDLRLQIKSGFLKEEPMEYVYMKRYPPMSRDGAPKYHKATVHEVPYVKLYEKVIKRNVLYDDEKVYPAFWNQEPQALTLAKKQYEHMQKGMDEEDAYHKAIEYVDELENESFLEMEQVTEAFNKMGAKVPFMTVPEIAAEVEHWRNIMKTKLVTFAQLDLADQGEIDYLIQVKILQWTEVERERRMKDMVFVREFEVFRNKLFPHDELHDEMEAQQLRVDVNNLRIKHIHQLDPEKLCTKEPFFSEDYIQHFERIREQPDLRKWKSDDRAELSRWIVNTLALREIMENEDYPAEFVQQYLNNLRVQYFPMIHFPERALDFEVPTIASLRAALYNNEIGYKQMNDKMYVRRAYKIPMLLFPAETKATAELYEIDTKAYYDDELEAEKKQKEEAYRNKEIDNHAEKSSSEILADLKQMDRHYPAQPAVNNRSATKKEDSMKLLDDILGDAFRLDDSAVRKVSASSLVPDVNEDESNALDEIFPDEDEDVSKKTSKNASTRESADLDKSIHKSDVSSDEWASVLRKYYKEPVTELERQRENMLRDGEFYTADSMHTETELDMWRTDRLTQMIVNRARLHDDYENKEAARRVREWKKRGVWLDDKMPKPSLEMSRSKIF